MRDHIWCMGQAGYGMHASHLNGQYFPAEGLAGLLVLGLLCLCFLQLCRILWPVKSL